MADEPTLPIRRVDVEDDRLAALEQTVEALRAEVATVRAELDAFRANLDRRRPVDRQLAKAARSRTETSTRDGGGRLGRTPASAAATGIVDFWRQPPELSTAEWLALVGRATSTTYARSGRTILSGADRAYLLHVF
jgi:hypothetical protein